MYSRISNSVAGKGNAKPQRWTGADWCSKTRGSRRASTKAGSEQRRVSRSRSHVQPRSLPTLCRALCACPQDYVSGLDHDGASDAGEALFPGLGRPPSELHRTVEASGIGNRFKPSHHDEARPFAGHRAFGSPHHRHISHRQPCSIRRILRHARHLARPHLFVSVVIILALIALSCTWKRWRGSREGRIRLAEETTQGAIDEKKPETVDEPPVVVVVSEA